MFPEVSDAGLKLWERHLDYLTPQHVPWSLVNDDFSVEVRQSLAKALLQLLDQRVRVLPPTRVRYPGPAFCRSDEFWPADGSLPQLDLLVTQDSFLIFNIMKMEDTELREWWEAPVSEWSDQPTSPNYKVAFETTMVFAKRLEVTNDMWRVVSML